jgi:nucleoside-diphosphate-sugar epimerase
MPDNQKYIQVKNMTLNIDKIKFLGFSPLMSFEDGLQTLCKLC